MKSLLISFLSLVLSESIGAESPIEGRVRLDSGEPVANAQVRIFDLTDLQRGALARATTDATGSFLLSLQALSRGLARPQGFALGPNYPNPFNPSTIIPYQLPTATPVRLEVFNLLGQRLATLVDGERPAGFHTATWHATDGAGRAVGAGVYIYRMTVGAANQTGRMVLVDGQAGVSVVGAASDWLGASGGGEPAKEQVYGLIVSGEGLVPYMDSAFRVEAGMAPVELVVSADPHSAGKATKEQGDDGQVSIPDAKLRAAIEMELGKVSGATITQGDMTRLTTLNAREAGIRDVTGLEFATNLTRLNLGSNAISDISPLRGLTNLEYLNLGRTGYWGGSNAISDISPLRGLTKLRGLNLGSNAISDISPLRGLTNLEYLNLWGNAISDISPLRGLTNLERLNLGKNPLNASSINDHIPALQDRGVEVQFDNAIVTDDPTPVTIVTDDPTPVTIPDAKLRAAIETALGAASGATITQGETTTLTALVGAASGATITRGDMTRLTTLIGYEVGVKHPIRNLTGLEYATNLEVLNLQVHDISDISPLAGLTKLTKLELRVNAISDVSPLAGLTNLTSLGLAGNNITDIAALRGLTKLRVLALHVNNITDIAALRGLTKLTELYLSFNAISDISPLAGLTNLEYLDLETNNLSDISPLAGLTKLRTLDLRVNAISDVSPLAGLTKLRTLDLRGNSLNFSSINDHIPALESHGVTVIFDSFRERGDFDIELVFLDDAFNEQHKRVIQYAARRWMSIIREDLPDYTFASGWSKNCYQSYRIPAGERIDDLRIYVTSFNDREDTIGGWGSPSVLRETSHLPVVGCMAFNLSDNSVSLGIALHEIGHVLGIGTPPWDNGFVQKSPGDMHFNGPLAIAAFNAAGGRNYTGKKVPLEEGGAHWRQSVLTRELMEPGGGTLSAITIQALADVGYSVDVSQADPYTLPSAAAKVVVAGSTPDDRLPGRLAPKRTCGVGQQREPIFVVDEQGYIVRTISP